MNIKYLDNNRIKFNGMTGELMNDNVEYINFVNKICGINTKNYEYIYRLTDNWTGGLLLIKGNNYRFFKCGSGKPLITESEKTGKLIIS
jgi:hypothetical protein